MNLTRGMVVRSADGVVIGHVAGVDGSYFTLSTVKGDAFLVPVVDIDVVQGEVLLKQSAPTARTKNQFFLAEPHWIEAVAWILSGLGIGTLAGLFLK